jgi:hypothetical protein
MPTPSSYGTVVNRGVKYIKVNRFDSGGLDRTDYLQQLQSITLTYPDRDAVEYPIATIQEQADYYLYGIFPSNTNNTSSKGEILDYSFVATSASSFNGNFSPTGIINEYWGNRVKSYGSIVGNIIGFMTASSGIYNSGQTPNKFIKIRISGSGTLTSGTTNLYGYITKFNGTLNNGGVQSVLIDSTYSGGNFDTTLYLTSSFKIIENDLIGFGLYRSIELTSLTIDDFHVSLSLHNSTPFNGSSSLTIFDPEFIDFEYNDYNALYGNAEIPQISTVFMDVDYSDGLTTPVNFDLIISGTADKAYVQDSNYASSAWSNIRYKGVKYNSYKIVS